MMLRFWSNVSWLDTNIWAKFENKYQGIGFVGGPKLFLGKLPIGRIFDVYIINLTKTFLFLVLCHHKLQMLILFIIVEILARPILAF